MKQKYLKPSLEVTEISLLDILSASDNEVFVDGDDLFN